MGWLVGASDLDTFYVIPKSSPTLWVHPVAWFVQTYLLSRAVCLLCALQVECEASMFAILPGAKDVDRLPSASTCYNMLKLPNCACGLATDPATLCPLCVHLLQLAQAVQPGILP